MSNGKRYTWTVSVIAMVDKEELIDFEPVQELAYKEFEESICSLDKATKDIKFVIYLYDVNKKEAVIKKSKVRQGRYNLKIIKVMQVTDFYMKGHKHLVNFFKGYVAKKRLRPNEEHKHFFITWGHAAGMGFYKGKMEEQIANLCNRLDFKPQSFYLKDEIKKMTDSIYSLNVIRAQLSITEEYISPRLLSVEYLTPTFKSEILMNELRFAALEQDIREIIANNMKIITAEELCQIVSKGLAMDNLSVCTKEGSESHEISGKKIQIMLCLSCYVNMIETTHALKDLINVFIAPQTMISHYGYNYKELFKLLIQKPSAKEKELAINVVTYYPVKYTLPSISNKVKDSFNIWGIDYRNGVSFSAMYLSECSQLTKKIFKFCEVITKFQKEKTNLHKCLDQDVRKVLLRAHKMCKPTSKNGEQSIGIIDYENFITEFFLQVLPFMPNFDNGLFYARKSRIQIASYYPGVLAQSEYNIVTKRFESQSPGLFSIFLPGEKLSEIECSLMKLYRNSKGISLFLKESAWDTVIEILLNKNDFADCD